MRTRRKGGLRLAGPAAALALLSGPALADGATLDADIRAALGAGDTARYETLYAATLPAGCDPAWRAGVGRMMARSVLTTLAVDAGPDAFAAATRFGRPWQVLVALGDALYERRDFAKAVPVYEEALDDMRDTAANPKPPPEEVERRVWKRAVEARALAPSFVATRSVRGEKSGLASPVFRTFTAEAVPVPVRFEYDSDRLTPEGQAAVADIYGYLAAAAPGHIVIVGHTDPQGSDAYNADLSLRRANRVAGALADLGYAGVIETVGLGKSTPFAPDDPSKYSTEELYAFDRRVEYRLPAE